MSLGVELAGLVLLAAWVGADTTAFGQVLVSQPLVAGWLAGTVAGDPAAGLAVGLVLQVAYTRILPLGGVVPEWGGPAAVTGGALAAWAGAAEPWGALRLPAAGDLAAALAVALLVGEGGRHVTRWVRRRREPVAERAAEAAAAGDAARARRLNRAGAVHDAAAAVLLTACGLALGRAVLALVPAGPAAGGPWVAASVLGAGWGLGLRALAGSRRWEAAGFAAFAVLVLRGWLP